jgi:DNA-binding response OmpR family regulator
MKTVMVVDDSAPVRQQVGLALREAGFDVVEAARMGSRSSPRTQASPWSSAT